MAKETSLVEFRALRPWAYRLRWLAVALTAAPWAFNILRHLPPWIALVVVALYGVIGLTLILPQKILVGDDGVFLTWAGHRRFISFADVIEVRLTPLGVDLERRDGRRVEVRLTHHADAQEEKRRALEAAIREKLEAFRALETDDAELLARGSRSTQAWIAEMEAMGQGGVQSYRTNAIPRDRLWALVENPAADASARQGAALALRLALDEEERARLASIAKKSASPRLRVALDGIAHAGDRDRVRVALLLAEEEEEDDDVSGTASMAPPTVRP